ncbi:DNA-binding HxlR family transcriptional regulator [Methanococcus maripaludis]|uniref:DNA-binding HxlR family transcriptional regulator n=1 Tax=Methanococcus maripaludis TaxID=39152 RepID=A0A7J9S4J0_METMI|nr:hypothetical protein [Methanococcus maripaludis]MBB6401711.1 DNA-binding HxlR family transcriptional regulator [Methanococcus maripaludis]
MLYKLMSKKYAWHIVQKIHESGRRFTFTELKDIININQSNLSKLLSELVNFGILNRIELKEGTQTKIYYVSNLMTEKVLSVYSKFVETEELCILQKETFEIFFTKELFNEILLLPESSRQSTSLIEPEYAIYHDEFLGNTYFKLQIIGECDGKIEIVEPYVLYCDENGIPYVTQEIDEDSRKKNVYIFCAENIKDENHRRFYLIPVSYLENTYISRPELDVWEVKSSWEVYSILANRNYDLELLGSMEIPGKSIEYYLKESSEELYVRVDNEKPELIGKVVSEDITNENIHLLNIEGNKIHYDSSYVKK